MFKHAQAIGEEIKRHRLEKGLTQWQLAEMVGCDFAYISVIERGVRNPSLKIIEKIEEALDIKFELTTHVFREEKTWQSLTPVEERWLKLIQNREPEDVEAVARLTKSLFQCIEDTRGRAVSPKKMKIK